MLDLYQELRSLTRALEAIEAPYALIGGIAVSIHTKPRATQDIDLLVVPADLPRIVEALAGLSYKQLSPEIQIAGGRYCITRLTKLERGDFMTLDLLLASDSMLSGMLERRVSAGEGDQRVWLASVEDLRRLKRLRGSPQDLADLEALGEDDKP